MVPKGWQKFAVGELCTSIVPGRNKPKVFDGDIPWVTTPEINGRYIPSKLQVNYVSTTALSDAGGKIVPKGAVVMAAVGELGLIAITSEPVVLNQQLHAFVCSKLVNNEFLAYWLTTQKPYMESIASKTTIPYMNKTNCESIPVLLPPLAEQFKIAQILSTWDKAISVTEKLLTNSKQQKKALMQQLLTGKKRLLDENGVRFSGEWKITKLIQMGKVVSGGTPDTNMAMYWDGDILWLTPTDVTALTGRFVSNTSRKITPAGLLNSSAVLLPKGSLMVCTRATIGALAISTSEICTNQGFKNIIPNEGFNIEFIYYLLQMNTNEMIKKSSGSTFLELSKKDFETLSFSCPFIKEQQKIAAVLSAADTEISTLEKKLACLKEEKKALMQQLLTGKRRVKVEAEEAVSV
ncbi:restriction endonuclease subunit S [Enterobacter cloacae complex sp. Mu1197]|uniref:Restriction endonuclease subunit S n=1 Tax=Enterobacter cloacae complex sp. Mu1197 TaxID=3152302 RepID=A0AAU7FSN0_9ENTR